MTLSAPTLTRYNAGPSGHAMRFGLCRRSLLALTVASLLVSTGNAHDGIADTGVLEGAGLFNKVWTAREGRGPGFNAASCSACHALNPTDLPSSDVAIVTVSNQFTDVTGGHLFQRFRVASTSGNRSSLHAVMRSPIYDRERVHFRRF
jgi:hypothetical protein